MKIQENQQMTTPIFNKNVMRIHFSLKLVKLFGACPKKLRYEVFINSIIHCSLIYELSHDAIRIIAR